MTAHDLYLISPQVALAALGILVILLDLVVPRRTPVQALAFIGLTVPLGLALLLLFDLDRSGASNLVRDGSVLSSTLAVDRFALYFNFVVLAATGAVILGSTDYLRFLDRNHGEFFGLILLSATGMTLMVSATELITIYVALELTTLPLAALGALLMNAKSAEAGMKFLIIGAISSAIMLYGMALVFGYTGSTTLPGIAAGMAQGSAGESLTGGVPSGSFAPLLGMALLVVGFGFKLSAVPFQMWVPDVYEGAPTPVVAFLSVASKAAAFGLVLRFFYTGFLDLDLNWGILLAILAAASMTVGNLAAIAQSNIKRLLGYSAIAHAGYILIGVAAVSHGTGTTGPNSVLFYLAAYAAANLTAFIAIILISNRVQSDRIEDYAGLVRRAPLMTVALALALVALIGVPPTGIFIAKIYVFTAAVDAGLTWLAILGVVNSVVSAYYYVRVIRVMFMGEPASPEPIPTALAARFALLVAAAVVVWLGIAPNPVLAAAESAAATLTGAVIR
jgi:NADH-quinone oxidoreductase subunit N